MDDACSGFVCLCEHVCAWMGAYACVFAHDVICRVARYPIINDDGVP